MEATTGVPAFGYRMLFPTELVFLARPVLKNDFKGPFKIILKDPIHHLRNVYVTPSVPQKGVRDLRVGFPPDLQLGLESNFN